MGARQAQIIAAQLCLATDVRCLCGLLCVFGFQQPTTKDFLFFIALTAPFIDLTNRVVCPSISVKVTFAEDQ